MEIVNKTGNLLDETGKSDSNFEASQKKIKINIVANQKIGQKDFFNLICKLACGTKTIS